MGSNKLSVVQNQIKAMKHCPKCGSESLIHVERDAICGLCTWSSVLMSIEAGELDGLIYEYEERSARDSKTTTATPFPMCQAAQRTA